MILSKISISFNSNHTSVRFSANPESSEIEFIPLVNSKLKSENILK